MCYSGIRYQVFLAVFLCRFRKPELERPLTKYSMSGLQYVIIHFTVTATATGYEYVSANSISLVGCIFEYRNTRDLRP